MVGRGKERERGLFFGGKYPLRSTWGMKRQFPTLHKISWERKRGAREEGGIKFVGKQRKRVSHTKSIARKGPEQTRNCYAKEDILLERSRLPMEKTFKVNIKLCYILK